MPWGGFPGGSLGVPWGVPLEDDGILGTEQTAHRQRNSILINLPDPLAVRCSASRCNKVLGGWGSAGAKESGFLGTALPLMGPESLETVPAVMG